MKKRVCLLKVFVFIIFLFSLGCSTNSTKPDPEVTDNWVKDSPSNPKDKISNSEAVHFFEDFFSLLNQVIFDPAYRKHEIEKIENDLISEFKARENLNREDVTKALNKKFKEINFSHLAVLDPEKTLLVIKMSGGSKDDKPTPAVSAYLIGDVGVLKISSFLVPSITLKQIKDAKLKLMSAKYLIYDMRDNGGGSASSNSYVIESIIGPEKVIQSSKSREGILTKNAKVFDDYFADEENFGSEKDIELEKKNSFVEWRTRKSAQKDTRPTIVLVNSRCGSSCDIFAAAIKEHGAAKIVGTNTAGAVLSAIAYKLGWRGYTAILPIAQVISPQGKLYEGIGVRPDIEIKDCEDSQNKKCVAEAIKILKR